MALNSFVMASGLLQKLSIDSYGNLGSYRTAERLKKLLSPKFIYDRTVLLIDEKRHPNKPWITRDAVSLLEKYLNGTQVGLEWGSGNGTAWFASRSKSLVSVEHYEEWANITREKLKQAGVTNSDYRYVPESQYLSVIDEFPDESFDYIVVDGLMRDDAFPKSMPKLRPGGWLIFDNVNWYFPSNSRTPHSRTLNDGASTPQMTEAYAAVATWTTHWTSNGVNDTAIFIKPKA